MDANKIINQLKVKYPNRAIVLMPPNNPSEIICEIDPAEKHQDFSIAIAVIDKSKPHKHNKTVETYKVIDGELGLSVDGRQYHLKKGDTMVIKPPAVHYATGHATWVECKSEPGWCIDDHIGA